MYTYYVCVCVYIYMYIHLLGTGIYIYSVEERSKTCTQTYLIKTIKKITKIETTGRIEAKGLDEIPFICPNEMPSTSVPFCFFVLSIKIPLFKNQNKWQNRSKRSGRKCRKREKSFRRRLIRQIFF